MRNRREFLAHVAGAVAMLHACGDTTEPSPDPGPGDDPTGPDAGQPPSASCVQNGASTTISANHGHTLRIPAADVSAGAEKVYDIRGSSAHPHLVTITTAQFAMLARNETFTLTSTVDGDPIYPAHVHTVRVICE